MIDAALIVSSLPALLRGAQLTLCIAFCAGSIGFIIGTMLAFARRSCFSCIRAAALAYVTVFQGTPMLVQILFVYYVLPQFGVFISPFWSATLAMGLNSGAYVSQAIRSGMNAVSMGQIEACKTLGLTSRQAMRFVVLPQALRAGLPSLCNEIITLIKDSGLACVIGVSELSKEASVIRSRTYDPFSVLLAAACLYLLMTATVAYIAKRIESKEPIHVGG